MAANQPVPGKRQVEGPVGPSRLYSKAVGISQIGLFILALLYTIYLVRPFLLPVILALLLAIVLNPLAQAFSRWTRLPSPISTVVVLLTFCTLAGTGLFYLSYPASEYADKLRDEIVQNRLRSVFAPITELHEEIKTVAQEVESLAGDKNLPGAGSAPDDDAAPAHQENIEVVIGAAPEGVRVEKSGEEVRIEAKAPPVQVEIRESRVDVVYTLAQGVMLHLTLTLVICYFLLSFGNQMLQRLSESRIAKNLLHDIARDVSGYLLTITLINLCLGICVAAAMALLGLPNPLLWGAMAALLNFIPYIGALMGTAIIFLVAATNFNSTGLLIAAPLTYYLLTAIEGNFVTPAIIGRRFTINPIVVFLWVAGWGALWGISGMLIGLPMLMIFRIATEKIPSLSGINRLIST